MSAAPTSETVAERARDVQLARHAAVYLGGRLLPAALNLAAVVLFVRWMGEAEYGRYALYAAVVLLAGNAASAWFAQAMLRFAGGAGPDRAAHGAAVRAAVGASALVAGAGTVAVLAAAYGLDAGALAAALAAVASQVAFVAAYTEHQARLQAARATGADVVRAFVTVALPLAWGLAAGPLRAEALLWGLAVGNAAGLAVGGTALWRADGPVGGPRRAVLLRRYWGFGSALVAWMAVSTLLNVADRFVIERMLGVEAVGTYAALYDVVFKSYTLVLMPVLLAAHPALMVAWNARRATEARRLLGRTALAVAGLGLLGVAAGAALAPRVVELVVGAARADARALVVPIALGAVVWQLAMVAHKPLEWAHRTGRMVAYVTAALAANVALNVALLPRLGLVGAALATAGSALVYLGLAALHARVPAAAGVPR